jgi:hypothetical protein
MPDNEIVPMNIGGQIKRQHTETIDGKPVRVLDDLQVTEISIPLDALSSEQRAAVEKALKAGSPLGFSIGTKPIRERASLTTNQDQIKDMLLSVATEEEAAIINHRDEVARSYAAKSR